MYFLKYFCQNTKVSIWLNISHGLDIAKNIIKNILLLRIVQQIIIMSYMKVTNMFNEKVFF